MNRTAAAILAGTAIFCCASTTFAADLIIDDAPEAQSTVAQGGWDGPFVGVFGGYAPALPRRPSISIWMAICSA